MSFTGLLPITCTLQTNTPTQDSYGQKIESWANTLTGIECRIDSAGGGLVGTPREIYEAATHVLFMKKPAAPTINSKDHRIVIDSENYSILLVEEIYDSIGVHHLEILLKKVT